ncbi:hypothetical protein ACLOJK_023371 [Asimina triloba]
MKEEIRGLKEARLTREMEASIMKKNQSIHTVMAPAVDLYIDCTTPVVLTRFNIIIL